MKVIGIVIRVLVVCVSAGMVLWCAASMILNIGSVTGMLLFGVIGICALFWGSISAFLRRLREKKVWLVLTNIFACLLGLIALYALTLLCVMNVYAHRPPAENATLVVLGCQVNGSSPSLMLSRRIDAAYQYLQEHPNAKCILSGGQGSNENLSEAQCMYNELIKKGISPERMFREDQSVNTAENIRFSGEVIRKEGLSNDLAIVTDGFHELRAALISQEQGFSCGAVPSKTPLYLAANFTIREMIALTARFVGLG